MWTLELRITPLELADGEEREARVTAPSRLILGMNRICERPSAIERVGCTGRADFPSLGGMNFLRVYLCHPETYPPACKAQQLSDGSPLPLLSKSFTPPGGGTEVGSGGGLRTRVGEVTSIGV